MTPEEPLPKYMQFTEKGLTLMYLVSIGFSWKKAEQITFDNFKTGNADTLKAKLIYKASYAWLKVRHFFGIEDAYLKGQE